ncbi:Dormancy/auxin associated family protein [Rhynchospora pubera]|uniref:Dormancy/auxin associated family protein n=1 Tax=Rhynchospora pubera TaxID=906938 RepID=A0AAV8GUP8_9POAL|nr:Dormancy/auxin associated family protein [Rhynchospora pubera]KAJ4809383.1 Dormancy/auxin associated family protein [Rhynchospora pubera]
MLEKLWDDVVAGPQPDKGLGKLRKPTSRLTVDTDLEGESSNGKNKRSVSMPGTPPTPATPSTPTTPQKTNNVWRSVFHPGSNLATRGVGANLFDRPQPNTPTVYDWLYSKETKSNHR